MRLTFGGLLFETYSMSLDLGGIDLRSYSKITFTLWPSKKPRGIILCLQQGKMSVLGYASKFIELSQFAVAYVADEKLKMNHFEVGLNQPNP